MVLQGGGKRKRSRKNSTKRRKTSGKRRKSRSNSPKRGTLNYLDKMSKDIGLNLHFTTPQKVSKDTLKAMKSDIKLFEQYKPLQKMSYSKYHSPAYPFSAHYSSSEPSIGDYLDDTSGEMGAYLSQLVAKTQKTINSSPEASEFVKKWQSDSKDRMQLGGMVDQSLMLANQMSYNLPLTVGNPFFGNQGQKRPEMLTAKQIRERTGYIVDGNEDKNKDVARQEYLQIDAPAGDVIDRSKLFVEGYPIERKMDDVLGLGAY